MVATSASKRVAVGRRVFLGMGALAAVGITLGGKIQHALSDALGSGLGGLLPGGNHFRIYTITGQLPVIAASEYRLEVSGLVERPATYTLEDLKAMPSVSLVRDFHCVTGWVV